jgi:hypothetical protein
MYSKRFLSCAGALLHRAVLLVLLVNGTVNVLAGGPGRGEAKGLRGALGLTSRTTGGGLLALSAR